jgi:hypothetical protein
VKSSAGTRPRSPAASARGARGWSSGRDYLAYREWLGEACKATGCALHAYLQPARLTGPNVRPADKSLKKIKTRLTELTQRHLTAIPLSDIVGNVNRSLRGWANYFHYRNSSLAMSKVRNHAEERLRTHLMKRHKVKDRGTGLRRFPSADLYGRYGLYKVPMAAGWRSAHASV